PSAQPRAGNLSYEAMTGARHQSYHRYDFVTALSGPLRLAERCAPFGVGRIDEVPVALDIAAAATDDEDDRVLVERVPELARCRRLRMEETAGLEVPRLLADVDAHLPAMDEVELVLRVVVVLEALVPGRIDERIHAERGHSEGRPHLPEAIAVTELV